MGQAILFASGKGGSGTTTFAINCGTILANSGARVVIVDMNIGLRNDDIYLGVENEILFDIGDVISGVCTLEKALVSCETEGLYLLPSSQIKGVPGLNQAHIMDLLLTLKEGYDYVLIDCPVGVGKMIDFIAADCEKGLLVVTKDYVSIRNTDALSRKLSAYAGLKKYMVINRVNEQDMQSAPSLEDIAKQVNLPLVGVLSEDQSIHKANNSGNPIVSCGSGMILKAFIEITARLVA